MFADSDHRQADVDPEADSISHAPLIDHDTLVEWKAEIRDFFAATEEKLSRFKNPPASHRSTADDSHTDLSDYSESDLALESPAGPRESEDGSLDRLQIIKNRLAAQLENSRR